MCALHLADIQLCRVREELDAYFDDQREAWQEAAAENKVCPATYESTMRFWFIAEAFMAYSGRRRG